MSTPDAIKINAHQATSIIAVCGRTVVSRDILALFSEKVLGVWPEIDFQVNSTRLAEASAASYELREVSISKEESDALLGVVKAEANHPKANGALYLSSLRIATLLGRRKEFQGVSRQGKSEPQLAA